MPAEVFIFLYGVGAILGVPIFGYWSLVARQRYIEIFHPWWTDRYFVLATAFSLISLGISIAYITRVYVGMAFGFSTAIIHGPEGAILGVGLAFLMLGFFMMVLLADLEVHPPKWIMTKIAVGVSVFWGVALVILTYVTSLTT